MIVCRQAENDFLTAVAGNNWINAPANDSVVATPIAGSVDLGVSFATELAGGYYHYTGSLTTPPCTQSVNWFVLEETQTVSQAQYDSFKVLYADPANNRPVEGLNGRTVYYGTAPEASLAIADTEDHYDGDHSVHWGYEHVEDWVNDFPHCGEHRQSPVDIITATADNAGGSVTALQTSFNANTGLELKNTGHGLQFDAPNGHDSPLGTFTVGSATYDALQTHFHCPSEHSVDGVLAACEMHIVTQEHNASGYDSLAVIGVLFTIGVRSIVCVCAWRGAGVIVHWLGGRPFVNTLRTHGHVCRGGGHR